MKKIIILVVILAIVGAVVWKITSNSDFKDSVKEDEKKEEDKVQTSETVKVSSNLSEYKNNELGFSVNYPTTWEKADAANNVSFNAMAVTEKEKNTVGNLQSKIDIYSGECKFPPVTTVKERDTLKVGDLNFNMISIANTVQGRNYFSRMYSLQKASICYFFTFTSVVLSPTSKGFVGADAQAVGSRNTAIVDSTDNQFKDMVKSFKFVVGPAGQDETKVSPKK